MASWLSPVPGYDDGKHRARRCQSSLDVSGPCGTRAAFVVCALSQELHQAQAHAFLLSRHRAITRIGLFLRMLEAHQGTARGSLQEIYMPMKRSDIGAYAGISLEAVGRSFQTLVNRGAIAIRDR